MQRKSNLNTRFLAISEESLSKAEFNRKRLAEIERKENEIPLDVQVSNLRKRQEALFAEALQAL